MLRIILEGGRSDTEREDVDVEEPLADLERAGERYLPVLDYWDRPMRDIAGRWRYRLHVPYRPMLRGYEATRIKP